MPPESKYSLSPVSQDEQDLFMKEFQELLDKHSMYFEPIPFVQRKSLTDPFEIAAQILLQKKTEIIPAEAVPEESVISPIQDVTPEETA